MTATTVREVKTTQNYESVAWRWMRFSAILLIPLVWIHVAIQDVIVGVHAIDIDYVALRWANIGWQVYDILLPPEEDGLDLGGREVVRVAFDPDALPEHPDAQLAGFGAPLIDQLLSSAAQRGRYARAYRNGLNLMPQGLADRIARALYEQDVTGAEPDRVQVAGHLRTRRSRAMNSERQEPVARAEPGGRETAQVKR